MSVSRDATTPMERALQLAEAAAASGEVPVGCVIVDGLGQIIAEAGNQTRALKDPTAHAEMVAIRMAAARISSERLVDCDLFVTLEPCPMCAGAISHARIRRVYFGADDPKSGGVLHGPRVFEASTCHHRPEVYDGIGRDRAAALLRSFFAERR